MKHEITWSKTSLLKSKQEVEIDVQQDMIMLQKTKGTIEWTTEKIDRWHMR